MPRRNAKTNPWHRRLRKSTTSTPPSEPPLTTGQMAQRLVSLGRASAVILEPWESKLPRPAPWWRHPSK